MCINNIIVGNNMENKSTFKQFLEERSYQGQDYRESFKVDGKILKFYRLDRDKGQAIYISGDIIYVMDDDKVVSTTTKEKFDAKIADEPRRFTP